MTEVRPKATRKASRRRLAMAVVSLVLLSSYVGLSYQTILSVAETIRLGGNAEVNRG